jgi:hypothetical protein
MKFYRVEGKRDGGESYGIEWFTSRKAADAARRKNEDGNPGEEQPEVEEANITPTKRGILAALNHYADHPDNG